MRWRGWRELEPEDRQRRVDELTGRVLINGCLLVLASALAGIILGELIWIFLRFLTEGRTP